MVFCLRSLRPAVLLALCLSGGLCACTAGPRSERAVWGSSAGSAPRFRSEGPRLPAYLGRDPAERGWVRVDGLLWLDARDLPAYRQGEVFDGRSHVPFDRALPDGVAAEAGFHLRTDHVALRTNLSWSEAVSLAREADAHVRALMHAYGEDLDLRLPADPLPIVVCATRAEFDRRLHGAVAGTPDWNSFYEARQGTVIVSAEPAPRGALPLVADLRHEMTHQILDLSRPPGERGIPFAPGWFWLWEGIAVHTESLGDPAGRERGRVRLERFHRRRAWGQHTPLVELFPLTQAEFEGRHYDQVASLMQYLLADGDASSRGMVLGIARALLHPQRAPAPTTLALRRTPQQLEQAWLRSLDP